MKTRFDELAEDLPTDNTKIPWYPGCEGCFFAADDGQNTGYKKSICSIYSSLDGKPHELAHSGTCEYYLSNEGYKKLDSLDAALEKGLPIGIVGYSHNEFALLKIASHKYFGYNFKTQQGEWFITPYNLAYHGLRHMRDNNITLSVAEINEIENAAKAVENDYYKTLVKFLNKL